MRGGVGCGTPERLTARLRLPRLGHAALAVALGFLASPGSARAQDTLPAVRNGNVLLHYWPGSERLARSTVAPPGVLAPLPGLPAEILLQPPEINAYLAPDPARFDSLTGGRAPGWGAGVAFPDAGIIVIPGYASERVAPRDLPRVLRHELAHIALHRFLGPAQVPRWFSEGYATWAAGQLDADAAWLLRMAFLTNRAPPLDSITLDWPGDETSARVAYLLSASAVAYLYENGAERGLTLFLTRWRDDADFEAALRDTYGLTLGQLERHWGARVRRQYGWLLFLAQSAVLWTIAGVLVLALYILRRRRNRARLLRLRAGEIPDRPAYWLGEEFGVDDEAPGMEPPAADAPPSTPDDRPRSP